MNTSYYLNPLFVDRKGCLCIFICALFMPCFFISTALLAQTARSIPLARLNPESAVYQKAEDKLYVLIKDDNTNTTNNSNHLAVVHPAWGRVEQKYQVGFNPRMLCRSSDQQHLYFLTDGPRAIKRFHIQNKQ